MPNKITTAQDDELPLKEHNSPRPPSSDALSVCHDITCETFHHWGTQMGNSCQTALFQATSKEHYCCVSCCGAQEVNLKMATYGGVDAAQKTDLGEDPTKKDGDPNSNFECNICLDVARDAVVSLCGHLFW